MSRCPELTLSESLPKTAGPHRSVTILISRLQRFRRVNAKRLTVLDSARDCGGSARSDLVGCVPGGKATHISALKPDSRTTKRTGSWRVFSSFIQQHGVFTAAT